MFNEYEYALGLLDDIYRYTDNRFWRCQLERKDEAASELQDVIEFMCNYIKDVTAKRDAAERELEEWAAKKGYIDDVRTN